MLTGRILDTSALAHPLSTLFLHASDKFDVANLGKRIGFEVDNKCKREWEDKYSCTVLLLWSPFQLSTYSISPTTTTMTAPPVKPNPYQLVFHDDATNTKFHDDATNTAFHDGATPTAFHNDATPTAFHDHAMPTVFRDDATPNAFRDDATPTAFRDDATPIAFRDNAAFHDNANTSHHEHRLGRRSALRPEQNPPTNYGKPRSLPTPGGLKHSPTNHSFAANRRPAPHLGKALLACSGLLCRIQDCCVAFRIVVSRSGSLCRVQDHRVAFRIVASRSGSSCRVQDCCVALLNLPPGEEITDVKNVKGYMSSHRPSHNLRTVYASSRRSIVHPHNLRTVYASPHFPMISGHNSSRERPSAVTTMLHTRTAVMTMLHTHSNRGDDNATHSNCGDDAAAYSKSGDNFATYSKRGDDDAAYLKRGDDNAAHLKCLVARHGEVEDRERALRSWHRRCG
ncbi:hypothetical protein F5880DRAFT_1617376 [Lentinula raphanica]|nr:hypothetical protein F5880DRAFT_1617376 [Lentinula raphanica]